MSSREQQEPAPNAGPAVNSRVLATASTCCFLIMFTLLFFRKPILERKVFFVWDHAAVYVPVHVHNARLRAAGEIPLWNRHNFLGYPIQAENELSGLYPPGLVFNLVDDPGFAYTLFIVFHHLLAAVGTMYLARVLNIGAIGQSAAALVFAFGGTFVGLSYSLSLVTTFAWAPLILGLQLAAFERRSYHRAALAGIVFALQTSGSHPQMSFYTLLLMSAAVLCELRGPDRWSRLLRATKITLVILLIGIGLSAPQVFYCLELMTTTVRWDGLSEDLPVSHSLPPQYLLQMFVPNLVGFEPRNFFFFHEKRVYFGLLSLGLIALGWRSPAGFARLFRVLLTGSLLLALGSFAGVYPLLSWLPGFRQTHSPQRFLLVASLAAAVLAGFGLDQLVQHGLRSKLQRRALVRGYCLVSVIAAMCGGLVWFSGDMGLPDFEWLIMLGVNLRIVVDSAMLSGFGYSALVASVLAAMCAVFWIMLSKAPLKWGAGVVAVGLLSVDLFVCNDPVHHYGPRDYYTKLPRTVSLLRSDTSLWRLAANHDFGFDFVAPDISRLPANAPALFGIDALNWNPGAQRKELEAFFGDYSDPARNMTLKEMGIFNVKYILLPFTVPELSSFELDKEGDWHLYKNPLWQPRAAVRERYCVQSNRGAIKSQLNSIAFNPVDSVALSEMPEFTPGANWKTRPERPIVRVTHYSAHRITIDAVLPRRGILVLSDLHYPGWQATSNGREISILLANGFVRGLGLGPGRHHIEFRYHPTSFFCGLYLAGATSFILSIWALVLFIRRRQEFIRSGVT